jgi:predicted metal-dependent HD superfamily phosphohydrolase
MTYWTKIANTDLALQAYLRMNKNYEEGCLYHNYVHISAMYKYLHDKEVPYYEPLDWAVMFHDAIYDNLSNKEKRSANLFLELAEKHSGCNLDIAGKQAVHDLIMATKDHTIDDSDRCTPLKGKREIIMADLHQLTRQKDVIVNYANILQESMELYSIDEFTFAKENIKFMQELRERMAKNIKRSDTLDDKIFFGLANDGINLTIMFSKSILIC